MDSTERVLKNVLKSKSSNSAISKSVSNRKAHHGSRKKSRSSADFPQMGGIKKRKGMYVEKRSTKVSLRSQPASPKSQKAIPPPRRARHSFVSSILTILGRDTQGTQTGCSRTTELTRPSSTRSNRNFKSNSDFTVDVALENPLRSTQIQARSPDLTIARSPGLSIARSPGLSIARSPDLTIVGSPDLSIARSPDLTIAGSPDLSYNPVERRSTRMQIGSKETTEKKAKYRSKALSKECCRAINEQLYIMKPKKGLMSSDDTLELHSLYDEVADGLISQYADDDVAIQILQDLKTRNAIQNSERSTVLHEINDKKNCDLVKEKSGKNDKSLFNFFVDILETTFSVYNVSVADEDKNFVIDPNVAEKLNVPEEKVYSKSITEREETVAYDIIDDGIGWNDAKTIQATLFGNVKPKSLPPLRSKSPCIRNKTPNICRSPCRIPETRHTCPIPLLRPQSPYHSTQLTYHRSKQSPIYCTPKISPVSDLKNPKQMQSASFPFPNKSYRRGNVPKEQSLVMPNKSFYKKRNKKEHLINILRNELIKHAHPVEEPQNMFQALQMLARNKERERKEIRFADTTTEITKTGYEKPHCRFKGRKVICSSTKSKRIKKGVPAKNAARPVQIVPVSDDSDTISLDKDLNIKSTDLDDIQAKYESDHSLEVNDYESDVFATSQRKDILFADKSNVYYNKDHDYVQEHRRFENRFNDRQSSVEDVYSNKRLCKKACRSESDLGSEIEDLSDIFLSIPNAQKLSRS